jgi:hypothetical protein
VIPIGELKATLDTNLSAWSILLILLFAGSLISALVYFAFRAGQGETLRWILLTKPQEVEVINGPETP